MNPAFDAARNSKTQDPRPRIVWWCITGDSVPCVAIKPLPFFLYFYYLLYLFPIFYFIFLYLIYIYTYIHKCQINPAPAKPKPATTNGLSNINAASIANTPKVFHNASTVNTVAKIGPSDINDTHFHFSNPTFPFSTQQKIEMNLFT